MNVLTTSWKKFISLFKQEFGFTILELMVVLGIIAILFGIATINLVKIQHNSSVSAATDELISDLSLQKTKAMIGANDSSSTPAPNSYGIAFASGKYTLFDGTSDTGQGDFVVSPAGITFSTSDPSKKIVFNRLSGMTVAGTNVTITVQNTNGTEAKIITVNRYGVVNSIVMQ